VIRHPDGVGGALADADARHETHPQLYGRNAR
jgi:hypothetical protein